jgi:hypothetical protein
MAAVIVEVGWDTAGQQMAAGMDVSGPPRSKHEVSVTKTVGNDFASNESYQMVNLLRRLHVSEQKPEPFSGDLSPASINARLIAAARLDPVPQQSTSKQPTPPKESTSPEATSQGEESMGLRLFSITSPKLVPEPNGPAEAAKAAALKEARKVEAAKTVTPRPARESMIMSEAAKGAPKEAEAVNAGAPRPARESMTMSEAVKATSKETEAAKTGAARPVNESTIMPEAAKAAPKETETAKTGTPHTTSDGVITSLSAEGVYDETWSDDKETTTSDQDIQTSGKRRLIAVAAVVALAAVSGAIGGALATASMGRHLERSSGGAEASTASIQDHAGVEESIARIDAELAALKELGASQSAKASERIDKVEKTLTEPTARLAKINEALEKLRAAQASVPAAAVAAAPKETTGSIQPPAPAAKPDAARQAAVARPPTAERQPGAERQSTVDRLPTLESWVLRDVANGGALIEGRQGMFEVFAGDPVPGLGRVDAIRRQDGRWVVVTTKGLIVAR